MSGERLLGGAAGSQVQLALRYASRHGLVAGATGTGNTVTRQCLAEGFSDAGVPVFLADVKGDLSGLAGAGERSPAIDDRVAHIAMDAFHPRPTPWPSGTSSASAVSLCARRLARWAHSSSPACSSSTTPRRACW